MCPTAHCPPAALAPQIALFTLSSLHGMDVPALPRAPVRATWSILGTRSTCLRARGTCSCSNPGMRRVGHLRALATHVRPPCKIDAHAIAILQRAAIAPAHHRLPKWAWVELIIVLRVCVARREIIVGLIHCLLYWRTPDNRPFLVAEQVAPWVAQELLLDSLLCGAGRGLAILVTTGEANAGHLSTCTQTWRRSV